MQAGRGISLQDRVIRGRQAGKGFTEIEHNRGRQAGLGHHRNRVTEGGRQG
jgi:hypothetical protein